MILHLKNGHLSPPPTNAPAARKRAMRLAMECQRIEAQLRDKYRQVNPNFEEWRRKAEQALRLHNMELRLLTEWLEKIGANMMRKARDLLVTLVEDECDFDEEERRFINELDLFVEEAGNVAGRYDKRPTTKEKR